MVRPPLLIESPPHKGAESAAVPNGPARTGPCRLLVIDDDGDAADSVARLASHWGHDARIALDGPAALALAPEFRPDVVLLDIALPGMTGYEVARRLRELPDFARALIITMTGYDEEEERHRSQAAGCNHHWVKPIDLKALESLLTRC
jgi:CheY-like chemotaxis protein